MKMFFAIIFSLCIVSSSSRKVSDFKSEQSSDEISTLSSGYAQYVLDNEGSDPLTYLNTNGYESHEEFSKQSFDTDVVKSQVVPHSDSSKSIHLKGISQPSAASSDTHNFDHPLRQTSHDITDRILKGEVPPSAPSPHNGS
uniref:Uncharacterized protein n=1 Tax=Kalanchoe fedtschenkoi TaxID=63787 RepID=A0A7N0ZY52_KALFE